MQVIKDIAAYLFVVFGYDAYPFPAVEAGCEIVQRYPVDPCADDATHHQPERIYGNGSAADGYSGYAHGRANIGMEILVDYLCQDVQPSGGSVYAEQDGLGQAQDKHKAQEVKPGVVHQGGGSRLQKALDGEYLFPEVNHRPQNEGGVNGFGSEFTADKYPGQHQKHGVYDYYHIGYPYADARGVQKVGDHYGKAGDGAYHKFGR